jgi:DNA invertase Pin-like site-specific DNA recombinase
MTHDPPRRGGGRPKGSKTKKPMPPAPPKSVVGYARCDVGEERPTLEKQETAIRAHCATNGLTLVALHVDDGAPSATMDRPGVQAALSLVRSHEAAALLIYSADRLTTNIMDLCALLDTDFSRDRARILSVCGDVDNRTAAGRMSLRLLIAVAQHNRESIAA